ncbi:MAG TPA: multiheme c-type cytochrome [Bryobacteraceae bacterium]|nr:multiheme c-type cytochrome [Bryobacteraceae bacterium]
MAHAMELVYECTILKTHPLLTFTEGKYSYRIERKGGQSIYSVTDGQQTIAVPIGWAFGLGRAGQTYVFEKDGDFYESRVSYYRELDGLDLTMGAANLKPANIMQAAGRFMGRDEKVRCFGCHATYASEGMQLTLGRMVAGVQCERCHGPSMDHLHSVGRGDRNSAQMKSLRTLSSEEISNFCGQCHRTWDEIASGPKLGVLNVRFQPYRLTNSKCYDTEDSRISCVACHDPHRELDRTDSDYDSKCQACHGAGKTTARACKVSHSNCVSCHMPKFEMPGSHYKFTDHEIRIVRANAPYPD